MIIGAYAYYWYSGDWLNQTIRMHDPPVLGQYDTSNLDVICSQMTLAKQYGIDFFAVSWWPGRDYSHVLDAANKTGMKLTYFYESMHHSEAGVVHEEKLPLILRDLGEIKHDLDEDCWLRINGKPVMMVYVTRAYRGDLTAVFGSMRKALGDPFLVGDHLFWDTLKPEVASWFDALTAYNMYKPKKFSTASPEETCRTYLDGSQDQMNYYAAECKKLGISLWGNALPGYDDRGVRPDRKHPPVPRLDGDFFKKSLENAVTVTTGDPRVVMITSYSEWYEDTQIEPATSYGCKYLDLLKTFKDQNA